jgi:hypothetical protein
MKITMRIGIGLTRFGGESFFFERSNLASDSKVYIPRCIFPDIRGPQSGERLTDRAQGVFHRARSDGVLTGRKLAVAIYLTEYLEERDRIFPPPHEGVDTELQAEHIPSRPMVFHCFGSLSGDSGSDAVINSADISEQRVCLRS